MTASGTTATFAELYGAQFVPLVRMATLLVGRTEVARDVVQEAFVRLHVKWPTVRDPLAYVRRSVVNGCHSHHRAEARARRRLHDRDRVAELGVDHTLSALELLPSRQRAALVLKFYVGCTEREIAASIGCRPGSVGPMVHRALGAMREHLSEQPQAAIADHDTSDPTTHTRSTADGVRTATDRVADVGRPVGRRRA